MAENNQINNYQDYNTRMSKSMLDKIFFVDKINSNVIVDYGCADGSLLRLISNFFDEQPLLLGYDIDETMIEIADEKTDKDNSFFSSNWSDIEKRVSHVDSDSKVTLVLSSIVHEVYHYSQPSEVDKFWKRVFNSDMFDYIVLRDMIPSKSVDRPSFIEDTAKIYSNFYETKELNDFESIWGSIENNKNLMHFLLKYKYLQPNWNREVRENYFPLYREKLLSMITDNYSILYHEHFTLPYIKESVKEDLGIEIKDNTHLKLILKLKNM